MWKSLCSKLINLICKKMVTSPDIISTHLLRVFLFVPPPHPPVKGLRRKNKIENAFIPFKFYLCLRLNEVCHSLPSLNSLIRFCYLLIWNLFTILWQKISNRTCVLTKDRFVTMEINPTTQKYSLTIKGHCYKNNHLFIRDKNSTLLFKTFIKNSLFVYLFSVDMFGFHWVF